VLPGLYRFRLDFTGLSPHSFCDVEFLLPDGLEDEGGLGHPGDWGQSLWDGERGAIRYPYSHSSVVAAFHALLVLLVKQTALFFLLIPVLWVGVVALQTKHIPVGWIVAISGSVWPLYRTNWLVILTSERATVDLQLLKARPRLKHTGSLDLLLERAT